MNRFLSDEDFDNDILRAMLRQLPGLDVVRVQDVEDEDFRNQVRYVPL